MRYGILAGVLILCASLAGCRTAPDKAETAVSASAASSEEREAPEDSAEPLVILDDEAVNVQLTEVYAIAPDKKDTETEEPAVGIAFSVSNHGEKEIVMDMKDLKVGDQPVMRLLLEGDIVAPDGTQEYRYGIMAPADPETKEPEEIGWIVTLDEVTEKGISGEVRLMSMDGETGKAEFSFTGDQLPKS